MSSKIRIKNGTIEVEYEGTEEFIKNDLLKLISSVSELSRKGKQPPPGEGIEPPEGGRKEDEKPIESKISGTTANLAAKLNCKSGPDLVVAACSYLTFVEGKSSFSRKMIIGQMKSAAPYYKETYLHNLSSYLSRLLKGGKLNETSKGVYSIAPPFRKELETTLAIS